MHSRGDFYRRISLGDAWSVNILPTGPSLPHRRTLAFEHKNLTFFVFYDALKLLFAIIKVFVLEDAAVAEANINSDILWMRNLK